MVTIYNGNSDEEVLGFNNDNELNIWTFFDF
jgi:hypothetical protein